MLAVEKENKFLLVQNRFCLSFGSMKSFFFFFNCSNWEKFGENKIGCLVVWCNEQDRSYEQKKKKSKIRETMSRTAHISHIFSIAISDNTKSTKIVILCNKIQKKILLKSSITDLSIMQWNYTWQGCPHKTESHLPRKKCHWDHKNAGGTSISRTTDAW